MTSQIAHDYVAHEGVRGRPIQMAYAVQDTAGAVADLSDITGFTVTVQRREGFNPASRPAVAFTLADGEVTLDLEGGQVICTIDEAASAALEPGPHDVQWDAEVEGEAQPTWLISILDLRESL